MTEQALGYIAADGMISPFIAGQRYGREQAVALLRPYIADAWRRMHDCRSALAYTPAEYHAVYLRDLLRLRRELLEGV